MARTINVFAIAVLGLWTLLSLGAWAVFSLGGDFVYRQLDWIFVGDPDIVPVAAAMFRFFQNFGLGLVAIVWALGSLMIWIAATIMRRLARSLDSPYVREPHWVEAEFEERPMKDVTPPRSTGALPQR
ncbi:MAG TPA: hypothetical protein VHM01_07515 [Alphaproteobacteria bacterium]|nr:hypothetical protein [Alphaproteobacteria bacterium]